MKKKKVRSRIRQSGMNPAHFDRGQIKFYTVLIPVGIVMALPIVFIIVNAFKPIDELFAYPPRFYVKNPTLDNFRLLLSVSSGTSVPAVRYLFNSIFVSLAVVLTTVVISASAGFALSKKKFRVRRALFDINKTALMFVSVAVSIPRYFVIVYTGTFNTVFANILPLIVIPTGVFLVKQFIDQLPDALIEAAVIDGASDFRILRKIVFPLIKPTLATVTILSFQSVWNNVETSNLYINNEAIKTFAFYMSTLTSVTSGSVAGQGISAAATLIMFLPNLVLFIILQSRVMNTMAHSGIK